MADMHCPDKNNFKIEFIVLFTIFCYMLYGQLTYAFSDFVSVVFIFLSNKLLFKVDFTLAVEAEWMSN